MKQNAWLLLGLGLAAATGCGGESSSGSNNDGDGGTGSDFADELKDLEDKLKGVGDSVDGLGTAVNDLTGRVDTLEDPPQQSCAEGELCIPDGIDVAASKFAPIVAALCGHEIGCCDAGELNYRFGPAFRTIEDCTATFTDLVNNGYSPDFLDAAEVANVIEVARALDDPNMRFTVDETAVAACVAYIDAIECASAEVDGPASPSCVPPEGDEYPCSVDLLLKGLHKAGEICNPEGHQACEEGLACRYAGGDDDQGICAPKAAVGDRCLNDNQCDDLFCDGATGKCQTRAKLGETCAYVDPTFEDVDPFWDEGSSPGNGRTTKLDCEIGLSCDPATNKCVSTCSAGAFCYYNYECPEGLVCNKLANEALAEASPYGLCGAPVATGGACENTQTYGLNPKTGIYGYYYESACASTECIAVGEVLQCAKDVGAACATAGADTTCGTGWCGKDLKCAAICGNNCSADNPNCQQCATGFYCDFGVNLNNRDRCEPKIANGTACDQDNTDESCVSSFCDINGTGTCGPKVAANAACPTERDQQCPAGQYCDGTNCTTYAASGASCATVSCTPGFLCVDVDGEGAGTVYTCLAEQAGFPDGTDCNDWGDYYCASGWCKPNAAVDPSSYTCTAGLADGVACDLEDSTKDHCGVSSFCAYEGETSVGTCKPRGSVGAACEPRFGGDDCIGEGSYCQFRGESFVCSTGALPDGAVMCDGV